MATILLTWELGAGMGHLANLAPLAGGFVERGHQVVAALRDLSHARQAFAELPVSFLQAPSRARPAGRGDGWARTFAHILRHHGFADADELRTRVEAWRGLYEAVRPDLVVFDHSPTALLAARGLLLRRILIGTGFLSPADEYPLRDLRPWLPDDSRRSQQDEDGVLGNANRVLAASGQEPLQRIAQLYQEVDQNFLTTFAEFDPHSKRRNVEYWGPMLLPGGKAPCWPEGRGKRIYAYLKPFPALPHLLALLGELGCPTLVYGRGMDEQISVRFTTTNLRIERERLDMSEVARQCDLAILNGTHATTLAMLLAGKPSLQIPIYLEQALNARVVARLGLGLVVSPERPERIATSLTSLLQNDRYAQAARDFAADHADFNPQRQIAAMLDRIERLLHKPV